MNITSVKTGGFANGFSHWCSNCGRFFSAQFLEDGAVFAQPCDTIDYCPHCGGNKLISSAEELVDYCSNHGADTVNLYHAFPPEEPIPNSITGATPKQAERIMGCVISDKQKNLPVTAESLAAQLGYNREVVVKVFQELCITETGGAA